ncbi:type IV pilus assembly protein PilE [Dyella sp. OK004]|uniref:type IV pilin protein n=1 Tax=Dyella sp. OK004 TaxID=1855292 RepID=UPI0008F32E71|nr:type IV pilin protein [Dyella sp. OK004]SFS19192.1 type IV pilus assembly protein PilE [Dyella sp. OK004]
MIAKHTHAHGFTLVELMIVVAVIAILAAVAIPSYGRYAYRARRVDGKELLLRIANAQERYYATFNRYGALTDIGYTNPAPSEKGYYSVTIATSASAAQAYTATASPAGVQVKDVCKQLSITNAGVKQPDASNLTANNNGPCW